MQTLLLIIRHALPVLFLGYAVVVNVDIFTREPILSEVDGAVVDGEAAQELGDLYSAAMPHRDAAVSLVGAGRYVLTGEGRAGVTTGPDGWLFSDEEMSVADAATFEAAVSEVAKVRDRLAETGTRLVIVPVPAKADIYRDKAPGITGALMERQYRRFRLALADRDIPSIDTRPALTGGRDKEPVYLTTDTHWTPAGAARVAQRVAQSGVVATGDTDFVRRQREPKDFVGDLVSFVTSDTMAPRLGLGPERVKPYVAEAAEGASGGIFASEDDGVDVVLVGTSYSANESWSFVPALKLALHRDVLNLATEGQGPLVPMLDYLADPARGAADPSLVLWEYPVRYLGQPDKATSHPKEALNG